MTSNDEAPRRETPGEAAREPSQAPASDVVAPASDELPGKADPQGWHRMHPLTPLLQGGLILLVIAGVLIANLRDRFIEIFVGEDLAGGNGDIIDVIAENGLALIVIGGVLGVVLVIILFSWLTWRVHTYRITNEAVENREGLVFKKHRRAPLERIQSVNLQRPLLARLVGLTKIEVQTAGQGGKVELAFLAHRDAKTVREQILRSADRVRDQQHAVAYDGTAYVEPSGKVTQRIHDAVDFDIDAAAAETGALVRVPVRRLAFSILLSWEMMILLVLAIASIASSFWRWGTLAALLPLGLVFGGIMLTQFNRGFNFVLSQYGEGVRTGSGLTSTNTESIPFGRIHAVEARQPLGWRPFGWWKVRITTAGHSLSQGGQNQNQNVVLPVGSEADVLRVLETLLPGIGDSEAELAELRNGLTGTGSGYEGGGPRAGLVLWFGRRRAGIRIDPGTESRKSSSDTTPADLASEAGVVTDAEDATLRIRRGALTRIFVVMPIVRAQSVQLRRPSVHRMIGLAMLQAHTVLGPVLVQMRGLELGAAQRLFDQLAATVVAVQSRESHRRYREQDGQR